MQTFRAICRTRPARSPRRPGSTPTTSTKRNARRGISAARRARPSTYGPPPIGGAATPANSIPFDLARSIPLRGGQPAEQQHRRARAAAANTRGDLAEVDARQLETREAHLGLPPCL